MTPEIQGYIDRMISEHLHDDLGSQRIRISDLQGVNGTALTAANSGALTSGGANNLKTADSTIIDNMRIRINEIEVALQSIGLLQ